MAAGTYVVDDLARFVLAADPTDMLEDAPTWIIHGIDRWSVSQT